MFGLSAEKLLILVLLAVLVLGPERLPTYAKMLGEWVRKGRRLIDNAQTQMKTELGEGFDDIDWRKLDPRQYDPRRIVREALMEPNPAASRTPQANVRDRNTAVPSLAPGELPPFDLEAT
jgi:sec-independent protein translocase protein TatB